MPGSLYGAMPENVAANRAENGAMDELRVAVVGAGRLGALHALKYSALAGVRLTHVVDGVPGRARETGERHGAAALVNYRELQGQVTAASVAAPSSLHHEIASYLLAH